MKYENVAYLCDGEGCSRMCARDPEMWKKHTCHHTLDENHARNKVRRNRKFTNVGNGKWMEHE